MHNRPIHASPSSVKLDDGTRRLGLSLLIASLSMLFVAALVAVWFTPASRSDTLTRQVLWRLVAPTVLALAISITLATSVRAVQQNRLEALSGRLWLALLEAMAFLTAQAAAWTGLVAYFHPDNPSALATLAFFLLTGLHALHVVGGLVPLVWVLKRARSGTYSSSRYLSLKLTARYWHFLSLAWLAIAGTLLLR